MKYANVVVAGGGVLGSQIAFQSAYCGANVTIWLRSEGSIGRTQPKLDKLKETYIEAIEDMASGKGPWCAGIADEENFDKEECLKKVEAAYSGIKLELDMAKAVVDADLLIESMAENEKDKIAFYEKVAPLLPEKTVIVTNSSTLLPSMFAKYTGRPEKYLSLHFANSIWKNNTAEIMAQSKTDEKYFNDILQFANDIRMIGLPVRKEKSGYLLNSMLVPFLLSGLDLYASGVSDPESIDIAWTHGTGAPKGPFQIFDTVGLNTAYNIVHQYQSIPGIFSPLLKKMMMPYNFKKMEEILKKYIDEGKLGMSSGEGSEVILDVERLYEVHILSADKLHDVSDEPGGDVSLGNENAEMLVEPLRIESSPASSDAESRLVDVVVDIAVDVVLLGEFLYTQGGLHASYELVVFNIVHHPVFRRELVGIFLDLRVAEVLDFGSVVAVREIVDFGSYLREEVVVVDVRAPHGLVHVGHQSDIGVAENRACLGGLRERPDLFSDLLTRAHHCLDILPRNTAHTSRALKRAHEGSGAEIVDEIVLVKGGLERHLGLGHIAEYHRDVRTVAEESDPCEILAPGEEFGVDEIDLLVVEEIHRFPGVFPFVNYARIDNVQKIHRGFYVSYRNFLAFTVCPALWSAEILETR